MKKTLVLILCTMMLAIIMAGCGATGENKNETPKATASVPSSDTSNDATAEAPATVYTVKFGITNGLNDPEEPETIFVTALQEKLDELTNGGMVLDVYPNLQLGSMEEMRDMVMSGTLEAILPNINSLAAVYPNVSALTCPGQFSSEAEVDAVLRGEWGKEFFADLAEETNLYVLGVASNGMRCYTSSKSPLTTVDSIKGQSIRVMQSNLCVEMAESIGINAVPMAGSEMYSAMQNGTVDGQENPINSIINDKTYEVQKYMVLDCHMPSILAYVVGYDFFESLPEEYQEAFADATLYASEQLSAAIERVNVDGVEFLKGQGIEVYTPTAEELEAWQKPVAEACRAYLDKELGVEVMDSIAGAIAEYRAG